MVCSCKLVGENQSDREGTFHITVNTLHIISISTQTEKYCLTQQLVGVGTDLYATVAVHQLAHLV